MQFAARYDDPAGGSVTIILPDGSTVNSSDPEVNRAISKSLDHEVTLWAGAARR